MAATAITTNIGDMIDPTVELYEKSPPPEQDTVHQLIYDYLVHHCYSETAKSFADVCQLSHESRHTTSSISTRSSKIHMDLDTDVEIPASHDTMDVDTLDEPRSSSDHLNGIGGLNGADSLTIANNRTSLTTLESRKTLSQLVLKGQIKEAIKFCNDMFPKILTVDTLESNEILFTLKCQLFIEYIRISAPEALTFAQEGKDKV